LPHLRGRRRRRRTDEARDRLEHDFKIIKINVEEKKVGLSLRAVGHEASRAQVEHYKPKAMAAPTSSLSPAQHHPRRSDQPAQERRNAASLKQQIRRPPLGWPSRVWGKYAKLRWIYCGLVSSLAATQRPSAESSGTAQIGQGNPRIRQWAKRSSLTPKTSR